MYSEVYVTIRRDTATDSAEVANLTELEGPLKKSINHHKDSNRTDWQENS